MKASGEYTEENFKLHDEKNPLIWERFVLYAKEVAKHKEYFSAKAIFHRIRWDTAIGELDSEFKISDGWISHYARKFMKEYPEYEGFFQTKVRRVSYFNETEEQKQKNDWRLDIDNW